MAIFVNIGPEPHDLKHSLFIILFTEQIGEIVKYLNSICNDVLDGQPVILLLNIVSEQLK